MRPKRERKEEDQPKFKDEKEALKWLKESLVSIAPEWIKLSILEKVYSGLEKAYSGSDSIQLPLICLGDLFATLSGFGVHEAMPSLEAAFRNIRDDRLTAYPLDSFLASYRTQLMIKRTEIVDHLATLAIIATNDPKLEKFYTWLEGIQSDFDKNQLPRFWFDLRNRFLSQLCQDLFSLYGELDTEMNGQGGIFQRLNPAPKTEDQISELKVFSIQIHIKANFFYHFNQYLKNYLNSEGIERDFSAENAEINGKFHRLLWDAKLTRELLSAGDLQEYLEETKTYLNEGLTEYQAISWNEFRCLDFVSAADIMRENIEKLKFLKRLLNDDDIDALLEKFSIMLELLSLCSNQEANSRFFLRTNLQLCELQDAFNLLSTGEANLRRLHERARGFEKEAPFLPQIFKEYFELSQKWRANLVIVAASVYESEIENINNSLEAFENSVPQGGIFEIMVMVDYLITCSSIQESIQNSKRVYRLVAPFHSDICMRDSLNNALSYMANWRAQLVNLVKETLSKKSLEQFEGLLPLFRAKVADWNEIFLGALALWADRESPAIIVEVSSFDKIPDLLGKFLRGEGSYKQTSSTKLFSSQPEGVSSVCGKVVNRLQLKIQLIKKLLHFSAKLESQSDLSEFSSLWMEMQSMLKKMAEAYQRLGNLPKIEKNQLMDSEVNNLQKNGRLLAFAQMASNNLRPSIKELISNAVADVEKAEGLQVEITKVLEQLKSNFSNMDECKRFLGAINADALAQEHRDFFMEFYFPQQQAEHVTVCEELSSFERILNKYLEFAKQDENYENQSVGNNAEPESPGKKSKRGLDEEPSSHPRATF